MRTGGALIFVNCDKCGHELELTVESGDNFDKVIEEELKAREWIVTDEFDFCDECKRSKDVIECYKVEVS